MKPDLPSVKNAAWIKVYKPSGKYSSTAIALMLVFGLIGSAITGVAAYYGGGIILSLAKFLFEALPSIREGWDMGGFGGFLVIVANIFLFVTTLMAVISFPAFVGMLTGASVFISGKGGKCRNGAMYGWIGFLCGIVSYGIFALMTIKVEGTLHETSHLSALIDLPSDSIWMYLIIAQDVLLVTLGASIGAYSEFQKVKFCEKENEWYQEPIKENYSSGMAASLLLKALETGDPQYLVGVQSMPSDTKDTHIALELQKCACGQSDYHLSVVSHWQEVKANENGQTIIEDNKEEWFETMISPELGRQIVAKLFPAHSQSVQVTQLQVKPEPTPSPIPSDVIRSAEIHCHKCSTINSTTATMCQQCGTDLLPGTSKGDRLGGLVIALIFAVACVVGSFIIFTKTNISLWWALCPGLFALIALLGGLSAMFGPTPPHERYYQRAQRHLTLNPYQAVVDLTSAINHASSSDDEKKKYIEERTKVYGQIGLAEDVLTNTNERVGLSENRN
jgi:hypothetical protein